ncbi:polA [Wigglesworthia glossinidia endosymbiont of Glossina brevipalpis]|uniref:PolA protein n=1 Tax=Wigglesworthia glossinidia brevipalpis TaxID=36870 RepID=Q8D2U6_WIGBR|nr:polA [Wigglesworthia glossinidia endosymbiont of Glossina brevipalpis]
MLKIMSYMKKLDKFVILIDGSIYLYKAYFGAPNIKNISGKSVGAIYGIIKMIKKTLRLYSTNCVAIVFDSHHNTSRNKIYKNYKSNRKKMPEDLKHQIPIIKNILSFMGFSIFCIDGIESDDIIGTMSIKLEQQGKKVFIFTNDKDMMQLVSSNVNIININNYKIYDVIEVYLKYKIFPCSIADYLALVGDCSDNIPGIPRIGEKTAVKLLNKFPSLLDIYNNIRKVDKLTDIKSKKVIYSLKKNKRKAFLYYKLTKINTNIKINFSFKDIIRRSCDKEKLFNLFKTIK